MSTADKVIKNTFYYVLFQVFGFVFPLILTPFIISKIGQVQFGIYALILGFIGMFNLLDLSISSSFIVFISRYYVKKDFELLNKYFNSGFLFYLCFSFVIVIAGYVFAGPLLSLLNIPAEFYDTSLKVYYIGLIVFMITSSFSIFSSVLISLQKMYVTSVAGIVMGFLNLAATIIVLSLGYGLQGLIWIQLGIAVVIGLINFVSVKSFVPELRISVRSFGKNPVKEMTKFGAQMQISKLATFASEKYDEFLLAHFSVLNNVTYYNIANRISRTGRLIPFQLLPQVAPVASELKATGEDEKIRTLFSDTSKYLTLVSAPVFIFIFLFADLLVKTWMGEGYDLSVNILRILAAGQLVNMTLSAPGNSIIPNTGYPKYQMREGLLNLAINIILSYFLIKHYGIFGAAIGNTLSTFFASAFIFFVSAGFFKLSKRTFFSIIYPKPLIAAVISGVIAFAAYYAAEKFLFGFTGRISGVIYILCAGILFLSINFFLILKLNYLNDKDKSLFARIILKLINGFQKKKTSNRILAEGTYENELVSIVVVTHNREGLFRKCIGSLLQTLTNVSYELIVIDNASSDGTGKFLEELQRRNEKLIVINPGQNIGINAKALGFENAKGEFIIGIDDDVIFFPHGWVEMMVNAYKRIPGMGYLATNVIQDEHTNGAKPSEDLYHYDYFDDGKIKLEVGPTGGWCFMISREVYEKIGKLRTFEGRIFYPEDGDYINRIRDNGLRYGLLSDVKVYHASGEYYNKEYKNVYEGKYEDYRKGEPFFYKLKTNLKILLSPGRYIEKLNTLASKTIETN